MMTGTGCCSRHLCTKAPANSRFVSPGHVSPLRSVPSHITRPDYAMGASVRATRLTRLLSMRSKKKIEIKTEKQIQGMRDACKLAREILNIVGQRVTIGITTDELDAIAHNACIARDTYPSPLGYRGFPKSVCTSVNNVACHGIPDDRPLCDGDIINIDVTVFFRGFHGDVSETFLVGNVDQAAQSLVNAARSCRDEGIKVCAPGTPFNVIGKTVRQTAESANCQVVPIFCGHGIGSFFHGPPDIIHIDNDFDDIMKEGMTFTVDPPMSVENGPFGDGRLLLAFQDLVQWRISRHILNE